MCDTMVALKNSTIDGSVIFAKNSDRQPNEPHIMIRVPRRKHDLDCEKYVDATYIKIPQVSETYEVVLLKPSWIWGCEMGWNEYGLNIGNEAVFTREKPKKTGLIGMDFVRIALERCKTSEEAVDTIVELLKLFGQGGNCGYEKPFQYDNSYLIADNESAWVLETAGEYWVAKCVKDIYCISNCLTIGKIFDRCHPDVIRHAIDKAWCKNEIDFDFAKCYCNKVYTHFSRSLVRRNMCYTMLSQEKGQISLNIMKKILRSHDTKMTNKLFRKPSVSSVCMHGGGIIGDQTTGSYVAVLKKKENEYWVTGASSPCISVFKPVGPSIGDMPLFGEGEELEAIEYWKAREKLHRMIIAGIVDLDSYISERDHIERGFTDAIKVVNNDSLGRYAFDRENEFIHNFISKVNIEVTACSAKGNIFYNSFWKKKNKKLFLQ